jgi:regulator of protease activity HflC (stomatin/prohibitin superfamily)
MTVLKAILNFIHWLLQAIRFILEAMGGFFAFVSPIANLTFTYLLTVFSAVAAVALIAYFYRSWVRDEIYSRFKDKYDKENKIEKTSLKRRLVFDAFFFPRWVFTEVYTLLGYRPKKGDLQSILRAGWSRGLNFSIMAAVIIDFGIFFWNFPFFLLRYQIVIRSTRTIEVIHWILVFGFSGAYYLITKKHSGKRGILTYLGHVSILLLGWLIGRWMGILLISFPLLLANYYSLYHLAIAIIPAANPDAPLFRRGKLIDFHSEKWQRFLIMFWYVWGLQYPLQVVTDTIGRQVETLVPGSQFRRRFAPGLIWLRSNQAVGLTTGPKFARAEGPGPVFTKHFERPVDAVDLRTQLRSAAVEVVTKDGNPVKAILFTAFAIDRQEWTAEEYHRLLKANPILEKGKRIDQRAGNYPYNQARIQAALSTTAQTAPAAEIEAQTIHWDDWVLNRLEEATRLVLSQRNLDELWRPRNDGPGKNALDDIGNEIKALMAPRLQENGVQLFTARVVNYVFPKNDPVVNRQIETWSTVWENRTAQTLAEGQAEAQRLEREAKAYARSMFLTLVTDGLEKARLVNPDLPKHVIALRVIGAMEELLKQQPAAASEESKGVLSAVKQKMVPRQ